jgi:hypothetical protein
MSEEHLRMLEALGTLAREEQLEYGELEALCDPDRRAQSLQRAISSQTVDTALALATQPLSAESQARIVQRVQEALRANSAPERGHLGQPSAALAGSAAPANQNAAEPAIQSTYANTAQPAVKRKRPSARAQPRRVEPKPAPKPLRVWMSVTLPLMAAAAGMLLFLDPVHEPIALPDYTLDARASSEYRGEHEARHEGPLIVPAGGTLELELRPENEVLGQLEVHVQLQRGAKNIELPAHVEQSPHGSLRVRLDRATIPGSGTTRLLVTLARPEALPLVAARDPNTLHGDGWQAWQLEVTLP